jgi:hypothetical protein
MATKLTADGILVFNLAAASIFAYAAPGGFEMLGQHRSGAARTGGVR